MPSEPVSHKTCSKCRQDLPKPLNVQWLCRACHGLTYLKYKELAEDLGTVA